MGDVVISVEQAARQATEHGLNLDTETCPAHSSRSVAPLRL